MPCRLNVALDPFLDVQQVFLAVLQVISNRLLVAVQHAWRRGLAGLHWHGPVPTVSTDDLESQKAKPTMSHAGYQM